MGQDNGIRYERLKDIVKLAIHLQASRRGLTLDDMMSMISVSRRTAERMRDAVEWAFEPLEVIPAYDNKKHWRLSSDVLRRLVPVTAEEMTTLTTAAGALEQSGLPEHASGLREIETKLRATKREGALERLETDLETLLQAEGLAMRAGPRQPVDNDRLSLLREAILVGRMVRFTYHARFTGQKSYQLVEPYGLLYGNNAFLVGKTDWQDEPHLWRFANMSEVRLSSKTFRRDPDFDLQEFAKRSFGTFQEKPFNVVLQFDAHAARDASTFVFHPDQSFEKHDDGSLTVRFKAGGTYEMCWHLFTWGDSVTVEKPVRLRKQLAKMCKALARHHGTKVKRTN
ncbi:MAG: WYL domain-containing protein [Rhodobacteraceae bacterium]|nr:WYL domain-containing protein [Paracoccaceae bacterium]